MMSLTAEPAPSSAATSPAAAAPGAALRLQALVAGAVLAAFGAFSLWVVHGHGYTGFLTLAGREPWGLQILLDLTIALWFALGWLRADARRRGLIAWPYFVATLLFGSLGVLAYLVRRGLATSAATPRPGT